MITMMKNLDEYDNDYSYVDSVDDNQNNVNIGERYYKRPHNLTNRPKRHYGSSYNNIERHYDPFE